MRRNRKLFVVAAPFGVICESCYSDSPEYCSHCNQIPDNLDARDSFPRMPEGFRYLTDEEIASGEHGHSCESCGEPWELPENPEFLLDHDHSMDG